jgi:hypothetical protein
MKKEVRSQNKKKSPPEDRREGCQKLEAAATEVLSSSDF